MKGFFAMDERAEQLNGRISFFILMLTQAGLSLLIVYRRYVLNSDPASYSGFTSLLLVSVMSYWVFRLYLSGILPVISWKRMLLIYLAAVSIISVPSAIMHGLPTAENWQNTILPAALGPALVLALYWLIAYLGKRRLDKVLG
jgi:hypothetical protein